MKISMECPICKSNNIVRVEKGNSPLITRRSALCVNGFYAPITKYICCNCGNIEEWVENGAILAKIKSKTKKKL